MVYISTTAATLAVAVLAAVPGLAQPMAFDTEELSTREFVEESIMEAREPGASLSTADDSMLEVREPVDDSMLELREYIDSLLDAREADASDLEARGKKNKTKKSKKGKKSKMQKKQKKAKKPSPAPQEAGDTSGDSDASAEARELMLEDMELEARDPMLLSGRRLRRFRKGGLGAIGRRRPSGLRGLRGAGRRRPGAGLRGLRLKRLGRMRGLAKMGGGLAGREFEVDSIENLD